MLDRPTALNALAAEMLTQLTTTVDGLAVDHAVDVIVLSRAGRAFSTRSSSKRSATIGSTVARPATWSTWRSGPSPTGWPPSKGGDRQGQQLLLRGRLSCCSLPPMWAVSQRLVATVGITRARLQYTVRTFTGAEAATGGLVGAAVSADRVDALSSPTSRRTAWLR